MVSEKQTVTPKSAHDQFADLIERSPTPVPMARELHRILGSEELANDSAAGGKILDWFAGSVVGAQARGAFEENSVQGILEGIEDNKDTILTKTPMITRADGLRMSVSQLNQDPRTSGELGQVGNVIDYGAEGRPVLRTMDQIQGYLSGLSAFEAKPWHGVLAEKISEYIANTGEAPIAAWNPRADEMLKSDNAYIRNSRREWLDVAEPMVDDGVDFALIERSANRIREIRRYNRTLGELTLGILPKAESANYDDLFRGE